MHPPLFKPHPLCEQEVKDLVKCHEDNAFLKFIGACNDTKVALDMCFREEKKLRVKLNKQVPVMFPLKSVATGAGAAADKTPTATST